MPDTRFFLMLSLARKASAKQQSTAFASLFQQHKVARLWRKALRQARQAASEPSEISNHLNKILRRHSLKTKSFSASFAGLSLGEKLQLSFPHWWLKSACRSPCSSWLMWASIKAAEGHGQCALALRLEANLARSNSQRRHMLMSALCCMRDVRQIGRRELPIALGGFKLHRN